jgi:hypothetical protein
MESDGLEVGLETGVLIVGFRSDTLLLPVNVFQQGQPEGSLL